MRNRHRHEIVTPYSCHEISSEKHSRHSGGEGPSLGQARGGANTDERLTASREDIERAHARRGRQIRFVRLHFQSFISSLVVPRDKVPVFALFASCFFTF